MIRARFKSNSEDPRPIHWPIKHPYWISGYDSDENNILIAYAENEEEILTNWPEAFEIESEHADKYSFTTRFPKPDWFEEKEK